MRLLPTGTLAAAIVAISAIGYAQTDVRGQQEAATAPIASPAEALRTAQQVRVVVTLADPGKPESGVGVRKAIAELQTAVLTDVFGAAASRESGDDRYGLRRMTTIPVFAIDVDKSELDRLEADPRVESVALDIELQAQLNQSTKIIQMNKAWKAPYKAQGTGRSVAVIDTGVNLGHKFLKKKRIIAQACFSGAGKKKDSFCPNKKVQQIGGNSGQNCPLSYNENCSHGTHVAGIASGFNTNKKAGEPTKGVAYKSKIIAVQVFKKNPGKQIDTAFSDILTALDWLHAKRNTFNKPLAAINMSIGGGGPFTGNCDGDSLGSAMKQIIGKLRNAGIAVVISSGNDGFTDGVSMPACVSNATTVGASSKKASGQPERIAYYSNIGKVVDVLAPGGQTGGQLPNGNNFGPYPTGTPFTPGILSSVPGNKFASFQGTSMAAPHVAGVFAAIKSAKGCGGKSVSQIETALKKKGKKIQDINYKKPRVQVKASLDNLGCG